MDSSSDSDSDSPPIDPPPPERRRDYVRVLGYGIIITTFGLWVGRIFLGFPIEFRFLQWWTYIALFCIGGKEAVQAAVEAVADRF